MPLKADELPSPFQHEDGRVGGSPSLIHQLWDLLITKKEGLPLSEIVSSLGGKHKEPDVEEVLRMNDYFAHLGDKVYTASVLCSLRWGVAGVGLISEDFSAALSFLPGAELAAAAASNSEERAKKFAEKHRFQRAYGTYAELAADREVDIVYVGNVHPEHKETILLMLNAGKHVLCEKPITLNAQQAEEVAAAAKDRGLFLMEAHWTRFFPAAQAVRALIQAGRIGQLRHIESHFAMSAPESIRRLYDVKLGGGALLDIGVYPLSLIQHLYEGEEPVDVQANAVTKDGVDIQTNVLLKYPEDKTATAMCSFIAASANSATVFGSAGRIEIPDSHAPTELTLIEAKGSGPGAKEETTRLEYEGPHIPNSVNHGKEAAAKGFNFPGSEGMVFEAMAVHSAVLNRTSEMVGDMPLHQSVSLMRLCDRVREIVGVRYDADGTADPAKQL